MLINSSISRSENLTITPEKKAAIARANDELHLAGIDTTDTQVFMPLEKARQDVTKAITLLKQNKYYEANIALKDAEDSVIIQK
ncbi:YfdX protein [Izhakiella capsodis]|uniref:YfdX protein n=1 Tax=Izhakiella capsodis TaxID=1367852 RepID=A0A1I4VV09_9GAMM|nr:YfdX family protein [Izhakiella capsodis]SFN04829.1 YfdX protein [Izhakiella capsodis]